MKIKIGYEIEFSCARTTPAILLLNVHHSRFPDLLAPDRIETVPVLPQRGYRDSFGNWCTRVNLPVGTTVIKADTTIHDSGLPDYVNPAAVQTPVDALPEDTLQHLLASRYCETEKLSEIAWGLFGDTKPGWARVSAICDFVHQHVRFGYKHARPTKTAWETYKEQADAPMDFSGWFEAYLDRWYTLDARHNVPRIGRILVARGRDAADVAISTCFGPHTLTRFKVHTLEISDGRDIGVQHQSQSFCPA